MPGVPFEYTFMDDALAKLYTSEIQLKKASYTATVLALIIVLLGCTRPHFIECSKTNQRDWYQESIRFVRCRYYVFIYERIFTGDFNCRRGGLPVSLYHYE